MIIIGDAIDAVGHETVTADWDYDPSQPLMFSVDFSSHGPYWVFSLDMIREALADPWESHGEGHIVMSFADSLFLLKLQTGQAVPVTISFPADDVRTFLSLVDDSDADGVIADELDEFLETIND